MTVTESGTGTHVEYVCAGSIIGHRYWAILGSGSTGLQWNLPWRVTPTGPLLSFKRKA